MLPTIAIVGRPNVGKSTLFNRLTKTRDAIVANVPGLTRDRQYGKLIFGDTNYIVTDTGGIGETAGTDVPEQLRQLTAKQSWLAINEAQAVLFVVDARTGLAASDNEIATKLRKLQKNKSIYLVINKIDGQDTNLLAADFYKLGLGEPYLISAEHGLGIERLLNAVTGNLNKPIAPPITQPGETPEKESIKIAFIGRPNVGKSTLINHILGEERVIVFDQPGTTKDTIYVDFQRRNKNYTLIDTAGIRRRGKIIEAVEKFSVIKALQAIESANVVVQLLDSSENITDQDLHLLGFTLESGKAIVIAVNKWDKISKIQQTRIERELDRRLTFVDFAPIHYISALTGTGVNGLFNSINKAYASAITKIKTPQATRILEKAVADHQPPLVRGKRIKLRYAHISGHNPPLIIIHGTRVASLPDSYRKYLENYYRRELDLVGTPIRIELKNSK